MEGEQGVVGGNQGSLARSNYKEYTDDYSTKPRSIKPPINSYPHDGGGCYSVMWTYPNASVACPTLLRYKWRKEQNIVRL
jgi:hypothetical protein